jgi:hypothetical protein
VCNYCHQIDGLVKLYAPGSEGSLKELNRIIDKIKKSGKNRKYDCIVGVSGGVDSSYLLWMSKEWGLRPLAVHYDNTWNTSMSSVNISNITRSLDIDLETFVVDNIEVDDIKLAFLAAGVREFDADTDIAFVQVLRNVAAKHRIKYLLEGHSFLTEGITPVGMNYLDGKYVSNVHKKFGGVKLKSFPNMSFTSFMKWILIYRQKFVRPLWYIDYDKDNARKILINKLGWKDYGGHHLENRASAFAHTFWLPLKFNIDYRNLTLAAKVRAGKLSRDEALKIYAKPVHAHRDLINYVCTRLNLGDDDLDNFLTSQSRKWTEFKTYKKRFEKLKLLFFIFSKLNLIPHTFYIKYCFPIKDNNDNYN